METYQYPIAIADRWRLLEDPDHPATLHDSQ
jgi:hypothetical protein